MRPNVIALLLLPTITGPAFAAPAAPVPTDRCEGLAQAIGAAIRMPVKTSVGSPRTVSDLAPAGSACLLAANAKGLAQSHAEAFGRLQKVLDGFEQIPEIAADGPESVVAGFRKGDEQVIVELDRDPPAGTCKDVVQAACKVPAKRWLWTFRGAAYRK